MEEGDEEDEENKEGNLLVQGINGGIRKEMFKLIRCGSWLLEL